MFRSKIFSALKFHIKTFKNKEDALDEFEDNIEMVSFPPIALSLLTVIASLSIYPILKVIPMALGVLSLLFLIYHGVVLSLYAVKLNERKIIRKAKKEREEQEEYDRVEEQMRKMREEHYARQRKQWEDMYRRVYEEEQKQKAWRNQWDSEYDTYGRSNTHRTQQSNVDQNMVNAMKLMGLQNGFTQKDVKSAYRRLSKIHHPDMGGSDVNFNKLNTAYNYVMERI